MRVAGVGVGVDFRVVWKSERWEKGIIWNREVGEVIVGGEGFLDLVVF